jgi:hypothetical protein
MDIIKRLWDTYALKLLSEVQNEISLLRIEGGKIEVDWSSFIKLEDQVFNEPSGISVPGEIQGYILNLYRRVISLLELLGIISSDKKICYEICGKEENQDPEFFIELAIHVPQEIERRFTRESDAKKYLILRRSYFSQVYRWEIIPPREPVLAEERVLLEKKREEQQMRKAELLFRSKIAEIVNFVQGKALINFRALMEFEELTRSTNGDDPILTEVQSRIWDRLQMMDIVSDDPNGNWLILSDNASKMYNPQVFGQPKYFRRREDALEWRELLIKQHPDLEKTRLGRVGTVGATINIDLHPK